MSRIAGDTDANTPDTDTTLCQVLEDITTNPTFAYTIGSTPRLIRALYQAQQLESQLAAEAQRSPCMYTKPNLSLAQFLQASQILTELNRPLDSDLELYLSRQQQQHHGAAASDSRRQFIFANLNLFRSAIAIYLVCNVLRYLLHPHRLSAVSCLLLSVLLDSLHM